MRQQTLADGSFEKFRKMTRKERHSQFAGFDSQAATDFAVVLPENAYCQILLTFFSGDVNLVSSVIVAAEEDPEP